MSKSNLENFNWESNWHSFQFVSASDIALVKRWLFDLNPFSYVPVFITAAGPAAISIAKFFTDPAQMNKAKIPLPLRLCAVFLEDPDLDPWRRNAHKRFYQYLDHERREQFIRAPAKWCLKNQIPFAYCEPMSPEGKALLLDSCHGVMPKFAIGVSNPWGAWHGPEVRRLCGEQSEVKEVEFEGRRRKSRRLISEEDNPLHLTDALGFLFGLHPNVEAGGMEGLGFMAGSNPIGNYLSMRALKGRFTVMGVGEGMDRMEYWLKDGPINSLNLVYPPEEEITKDTLLQLARQAFDAMTSWQEKTLRECFARVLAERVCGLARVFRFLEQVNRQPNAQLSFSPWENLGSTKSEG